MSPIGPLDTPAHPQYRHLVVKSGTTAGQHDMSSACGSGWCYFRCTPTPSPPQCPPGRSIWWPRVVITWVPLMFYCLQCSIDHLEFSRLLCNRPIDCSDVTPQFPLTPPMPPLAPWCPTPPQYRHLVVKSGTTAGQHDIWSACGSGWCLIRCTPTPSPPYPLMPPR